jgi:Na+-driven multidrug efflux pump
MMNALATQKQNQVSAKTKKWTYLISIGVPPFGLLFALKYFYSDEEDAKTVAWSCVILTAVSILLFWLLGAAVFSGSGTSVQQLQQIKPTDVYQLGQ